MKIREMNVGSVYSVDELGRARLSVCPCCGKQFTAHRFVRCCVAPDKGAQNEKSIVGVGCIPVVSDKQKSERRLVLKLKLKNGETSIANLLYATRNESREFTLPRDEQGKFQTTTLTVYVPDGKGTQALAKLASAVSRYAEVTKQDVGNGWEPVDSSRWTEVLGIAKIYRGEKAYGI